MREGYLERDGVRLHWVEWEAPESGPIEKPALLCLHGLSSNALYWGRLAARFPHRRVVALDQRSHGGSDRPPAGYAAGSFVEDAAHTIRQLGLGRPLILGHSWGAGIALELAATQPDLAAGLCFIDGPAGSMSERFSWEQAQQMMQPPLPVFQRREEAWDDQKRYLQEAWGDDLRTFAEARTVREGENWILTLTAPVRLEILKSMYHSQPELLWGRLEGPALLAMAGGQDSIRHWRESQVAAVGALNPGVDVRWYDSAHDVPLIRADELADDVERTAQRAAWRELAKAIGAADGDWSRPAGMGEWSAKDLLAHIASTHSALPAVLSSRPEPGVEPADGPKFDPDRWNASQLRRRAELGPEELKVEVAQAAAGIDRVIASSQLSDPVALGTYGGNPLGSVLRSMIGHQSGHLAEIRAAFG